LFFLGLVGFPYAYFIVFDISSYRKPCNIGIQKELFGVKRFTLSIAINFYFDLGVVVVSLSPLFSPEKHNF
jgi:hypothetical protein